MADSARATILVVDDEAANRELLRAYLEPRYDILQAANGEDAIAVLTAASPDLVILDVMMPKVSGYDTCRQIKSMPRKEFLPVILLTALTRQEDINTGLEAGADEFLSKPVYRRELLLRVETFLRIREQDLLIRKQLDDLRQVQALKDDLVSLLVHDLRNPLTSVRAGLELIQMRVTLSEDVATATQVGRVLSAVQKIEQLTACLLEVRRLENHEVPLTLAEVPVLRLVGDAIQTLEEAARARKVEIILAHDDAPVVEADGTLVRRSIENLLANALKYSPSGKRIRVTVRHRSGEVEIEIADRGPGIPDEFKQTIFEKFASVETSTGNARRGFGLGLHLVKLVAAAHGGQAAVCDREGGGTVFRLFLPQKRSPASSARGIPEVGVAGH